MPACVHVDLRIIDPARQVALAPRFQAALKGKREWRHPRNPEETIFLHELARPFRATIRAPAYKPSPRTGIPGRARRMRAG